MAYLQSGDSPARLHLSHAASGGSLVLPARPWARCASDSIDDWVTYNAHACHSNPRAQGPWLPDFLPSCPRNE
jgi:hypothetical protein